MLDKKGHSEDLVELRFLEGVTRRTPDDPNVLKALADLYTKVGLIREGLEVDSKLSRLCPAESEVWYNLACSYALLEARDDAFKALHKAHALGYDEHEWMEQDGDLVSLKDDPRYHKLLDQMKSEDRF